MENIEELSIEIGKILEDAKIKNLINKLNSEEYINIINNISRYIVEKINEEIEKNKKQS